MNTVLIIGAGASGMMAAISARQEDARVILIEHMEQVGKKLLATGNGRCNFTNISQDAEKYRSDNPDFSWHVIQKFTALDTIAFFLQLGIYSKNRNGYLYPYSDQAASVRQALEMKLNDLGVEVYASEEIQSVTSKSGRFHVKTDQHRFQGESLILATGSKAYASSGSDGSGYLLARQFGHAIVPVVPALVQLRCKESFYKNIAGIRVQGRVSLFCDQKMACTDLGEIQLTKYGISGIPVFQVSRYAAKALSEKKQVSAVIDFMPDFESEALRVFLKKRIRQNPAYRVNDFLNGLFPYKLAVLWYKLAKLPKEKPVEELTEQELMNLVHLIKEFRTVVTETNDFSQAQVCAGGVDTREINPETMESRFVPGLYFAGELLDVDGICGGYNLQWAWSSGYIAGKEAAHAEN
ncbi:MAG: NAD(P)/FAD-dependent oxidoreductase [Hespellia sp.]|nr:NAD(P)/FAD-dependent oxidoreductase [Hespellia sp.]